MKKALSIFLIVLAIAHVAGVMPFYFYALQEFKTEMTLKLGSNDQLQKILVTGKEFNDASVFQQGEENEFTYRGRMYDYKSIVKEDGNYIFYALEDNKETDLNGFLKYAFDNSNSHSKNTKSPFSSLFKNLDKDFVSYTQAGFAFQITSNSYSILPIKTETCEGFHVVISSPPDLV